MTGAAVHGDAPERVAPAATARRRRTAEHRIYSWAVVAAFAVVFVGFARTYYLKFLFGTPSLSTLVQLHGALMTGWFVLFFVQSSLIATRRVGLHRRVGTLGAAWAALMVVVAVTVAVRAAARDVHHPDPSGPPPLAVLGFLLFVLLIFASFVAAAIVQRRRTDWHKRLMLLSCIIMIGPGLTRIPLEGVPALAFLKTGGPTGLFSLDLLLLYACIAWDTWHTRRLHPAFVLGAVPIVFANLPFIWRFVSSAAWTHLATSLVR